MPPSRSIGLLLVGLFSYHFASLTALAQTPSPRNFEQEIRQSLQKAKNAAEFDFLGTLARTCLLPQSEKENTTDIPAPYVTDPNKIPDRKSWYAEPQKVFDNFYFVGGKIHSAWAITTSEGIILLDTIYPYNSETLIIEGMKKLGLNPQDIKYLIISHAHGDHIGGAEMLQKKYGMHLVMGAPDWDWVEKYPNRYKSMAPKKDMVATEGMQIRLGQTTVTLTLTPGHTPGTISSTFQVLDQGRPVNVAYSGGTAFNFVNDTPIPGIRNFDIYIDSQKRFAAKAAQTGATVLISNHSEFDNADTKNKILPAHPEGVHPYEIGATAVARYFDVTQNCARAAQIRLEQIQSFQGQATP
jgi:metallo-beta-lactamase class B